jgi:hypothetical protein
MRAWRPAWARPRATSWWNRAGSMLCEQLATSRMPPGAVIFAAAVVIRR